MDKVIWMPDLCARYDFGILLDRDFAREMIHAKVPIEKQNRMNELACEESKKLGVTGMVSYTFHEDSGFVYYFSLGQGVCLSTGDCKNIEDLLGNKNSSKPIKYSSHNVDSSYQAYALMGMFDLWVRYADILVQK